MASFLIFLSSLNTSLTEYVECSSPWSVEVACFPNSLGGDIIHKVGRVTFIDPLAFQNFTFLLRYSFRTFVKALARSQIGVIFSQLFLGNESQNRIFDTNLHTLLLD